jgi:hypothetical protein
MRGRVVGTAVGANAGVAVDVLYVVANVVVLLVVVKGFSGEYIVDVGGDAVVVAAVVVAVAVVALVGTVVPKALVKSVVINGFSGE